MTRERVVTAILALQLVAAQALATCGNNTIEKGEQCDGTNDSGCPGMCSAHCTCPPVTTINIPSKAKPRNAPGSPKVKVTNAKLLTQFGPKKFSLNNARYTRFQLDDSKAKPDAILILIPGFGVAPTTSASLPRVSSSASIRTMANASRCGPSIGARISSRIRRASTLPRTTSIRCSQGTGCSGPSWRGRLIRGFQGDDGPSSTTHRTTFPSLRTGPISSSPKTSMRFTRQRGALRRRDHAVHDRHRGDGLRRQEAAEVHTAHDGLCAGSRPPQSSRPRVGGSLGDPGRLGRG